ncbi:hypothetical protein [Pedobacter heparinus]|uniref:hypothetical protein n=1 Tax=Pedobacter heparinus TaxID=984 RepID=UPI002931CBA0|nr:hypothetical protein [Pedobacter heparinus]
MMKKLIVVLLFVVTALSAKAQENDHGVEQLKKQLSVYLTHHPSSNLYLQLDKNIYSPEENIWFKAYLLSDTSTANKVLYVRITDEAKEIVHNAQFPMYDIRSHGNIQLRSNLEEGKYTLYAYTDRMISYGDTNVFVQPIQIRKMTGKKLEAEASVADTTRLIRGGKVQVITIIRESGKLAKNVKGEYELLAGEKAIKYGRLSTNLFGEAFINFTYPELKDNQSLKINMLFRRDNDYAELSLNLPHEGNPLKVSIYPEGGQLLAGVSGKVAIEVLDIHQNPIPTELLVKNAGRLIAKLRTNKQGIATLSLKPELGATYTVETAGKMKQTIVFPEIIKPAGYSLKLHMNKEEIEVTVYNKNKADNALLVLRSAKEVLWSQSLKIPPDDSVKVPVPAAGFPKNILSLAVLDGQNKPQAERLFLNKAQEDYKVRISTDRKDYGLQKKVTVTVKISDTAGNPVVANLAVGATEKNRIDSVGYRTILQSWYYHHFEHASRNRLLSAKSANETDGLLMVNTWGNNQWKTISDYQPTGLPLRLDNTDAAIGMVIPTGKKEIEEIDIKSTDVNFSLAELNKKNILQTRRFTIKLDKNKMFMIPASELLSFKGKEWMLDIYKVVKPAPDINFEVQWKDHDIHYDNTVVKGRSLFVPEIVNFFSRLKNPVVSDFKMNGINQLAEVTVGGKDEIIRKRLKDKCADWVCGYNNINCSRHPTGTKPVKGKTYFKRSKGIVNLVTNIGCDNYRDVSYIKNITIPEEFYLPDYDSAPFGKFDPRSTIYWNPNLVTDANGTATFSFFTSDIMGEFEIIAQGLEVNTFKALMGRGGFKVTPK